MNKEASEKTKANRKRRREEFSQQTITVESWKIVRIDELNWQLQFNGKERGYFGSLLRAFKALADESLGEEAKNSLAEVVACQKAIHKRIEDWGFRDIRYRTALEKIANPPWAFDEAAKIAREALRHDCN